MRRRIAAAAEWIVLGLAVVAFLGMWTVMFGLGLRGHDHDQCVKDRRERVAYQVVQRHQTVAQARLIVHGCPS